MPTLDALHEKIDGIAAAFEGALSLSGELQEGDDAQALSEVAALLNEALSLVRSSKAKAPKRGGSNTRPEPETNQVGATLLSLPTAVKQVLATQDTVFDLLDPEEREERELAALRAQFAAGAAEEDEQLDWSAMDGDGSDDEGEMVADNDDDAARAVLDSLSLSSATCSEAAALDSSWANLEGFVPQGTAGFNEFAREQMRLAGVPANSRVRPPSELEPPAWLTHLSPRLQPYQETVAFLCRPQSLHNPRMLVVHRTGSGKTATMIQVADNYFLDRRPKVLIFPTNAVCNSFYRELHNPNFPNRYQAYLKRGGFVDSKKALELSGILRNGCVAPEFVDHPDLPSAPLRAFSYTMAGGASSCGARPNAVFK